MRRRSPPPLAAKTARLPGRSGSLMKIRTSLSSASIYRQGDRGVQRADELISSVVHGPSVAHSHQRRWPNGVLSSHAWTPASGISMNNHLDNPVTDDHFLLLCWDAIALQAPDSMLRTNRCDGAAGPETGICTGPIFALFLIHGIL